jgi:AAA family ATP:ADP antiporter
VVEPQAVLDFTLSGTTLFYSDFYFWVNVAALVLQAFVASRLLRWGGFGAILLLLPAIALLSYSAMALVPLLAVVKVMKVAENATDYSINNTARHVLWLPVSSELKFKGKPAIDTFVFRIGDFLAALTVMVGVQLLALPTQAYFVFNVALVVGWLGFAVALIQGHGRLTREAETGAAA